MAQVGWPEAVTGPLGTSHNLVPPDSREPLAHKSLSFFALPISGISYSSWGALVGLGWEVPSMMMGGEMLFIHFMMLPLGVVFSFT